MRRWGVPRGSNMLWCCICGEIRYGNMLRCCIWGVGPYLEAVTYGAVNGA